MQQNFTKAFLVLFVASAAWAQTAPTSSKQDFKRQSLTTSQPVSEPPIDLKSAVSRALQGNNAIMQAHAKIEQDRYDRNVVRSYIFPTVNATATAGEYKNSLLFSGANIPLGGGSHDQVTADLKFSQPLFAWGSLAAIRVADYTTKLNEIDLELAERTLTSQVIQGFYAVMLQKKLLEILERMQKVVGETLATTESRLRTGRGQLLDVLSAKTQMALLLPQIENAHNQLESAAAQLATYMSEQGKYELQVQGQLKGLLLKDIQPRLNFNDARLPELERLRVQRDQLEQQKDVTLGPNLPSLSLNGDYGYSNYSEFNWFTKNSNMWSVYLQLNIPIFSGLSSVYQQRSLSEQDRQIDYQTRDLRNTLTFNEVQSLKALQSTGASLLSAEDASKLADQSMAEARRNYRLATIDFVQFLTIEQTALQADSSLNTIRDQNIVALANYFVAAGQPLSVLIDLLQAN